MAIIRVSPSGPELAYPPTDVGKVLQVDLDGTVSPGAALAPSSVVSTIAALQALPNAVIGQLVRVQSLGRSFITVPAGTSALQSCVVVASLASPTVQFQSVACTSDLRFRNQTAWYVDFALGDDEATGLDALNALKTTDEIQRRWGGITGVMPTIDVGVVITIISAPESILLSYARTTNASGITVRGVPVSLVVSTVGTYTPKNNATNEGYLITSPGVADWTPYLGKRILVNGNAVSFVIAVNPDGSGVATARVSPFYQFGTFGTLTNPAPGQSLEIQDLPVSKSVAISAQGGTLNDAADPSFVPSIIFRDHAVSTQCSLVAPSGIGNIKVFGSDIVDLQFLPQGASAYVIGSRERYAQVNIPQHYARGVLFDKSTYLPGFQYRFATTDVWNTEWKDCVWSNIGLQIAQGSSVFFQDCQAFDWSTSAVGAIELSDNASAIILVAFSGRSTAPGTYGVKVRPTTTLIYNALTGNAAGASGEITCTAIGAFLWSDKPRRWAKASGTAQLVAGATAPILSKNIPVAARLVFSRDTPGGALGNLSAPVADRTGWGTAASQFILRSDSATETSQLTWSWDATELGSGGVYSH